MKTRQEIDETDRTGGIYIENETKLPCVIGSGAVYDEKQTRQ